MMTEFDDIVFLCVYIYIYWKSELNQFQSQCWQGGQGNVEQSNFEFTALDQTGSEHWMAVSESEPKPQID